MNIWIINPYGNIPGEGWREYRSTMIAEALNKCGHKVTWWTSNFEHRSKKFRSDDRKSIKVNLNFTIELVPTTAYNQHISIKRIKSERRFIKNFKTAALISNEVIDIIISAEPALFVSDVIIEIVKYKKAKLIIDIIDLWPELFKIVIPRQFGFLSQILLSPLYLRRKIFLKKADALIAVATDYLGIGLKINNTKFNEVIYWGVDVDSIKDFIKVKGIFEKKDSEFWIIYAGTFGDNYDLKTIMKCALEIEKSSNNIKLMLAGDGVLKPYVTEFIKINNLTKTTYLGSINPDKLNELYQYCDAGLCSYVENSTVSMPVKAYDYLSAGMALISSLKRDLGQFVSKYELGVHYQAENANAMFNSILKLYNSPEILKKIKVNSINLSNIFNKDIQYSKIVTLCENVYNE